MSQLGTRTHTRKSLSAAGGSSRRDTRRVDTTGAKTLTTVSFTASGTIGDSAGGLEVKAGDQIEVRGSPLNSRVYHVTAVTPDSAAVAATGAIRIDELPTALDTVTLNGTAITFQASGATGDDVNIVAGDVPATVAALVASINASVDAQVSKFTASQEDDGITMTLAAVTAGTGGNSLTLASSNAAQTVTAMAGGAAAVSTDTLTVVPALIQNEAAGASIQIIKTL